MLVFHRTLLLETGISKQAGDHQSSDSYLDNISPVALVEIIIFWPLINFSRSPIYSVSDGCFKTFWGMLKLRIDECTTPKNLESSTLQANTPSVLL